MSHAPLAPSAAHRWMHCPASVQAERGFPDVSSSVADEGTAMHEVRARCLRTGKDPFDYLGWTFHGGARRAFVATRERLEALCEGLDTIRRLCARDVELTGLSPHNVVGELHKLEPRHVLIEEKLTFEDPRLSEVHGTLDFAAYLPWVQEIVKSDLKFGQGVPVYAENNEQQLIYAALFVDSLTAAERKKIKNVRIIIDQPRIAGAGGEWVISLKQLEAWVDNFLYPAVEAVHSSSPVYRPGKKQCFWCKARRSCAAHTDFNIETLGVSFDDERDSKAFATDGVIQLSAERRAYLVSHRNMLEKFLESVEESVLSDALTGLPTPGLKAILGNQGKRSWADEDGAEEELVKLLEGDCYDTKLISPAVAEDRLPREAMKVLRKYIYQDAAKPKLVPLANKKPAYVPVQMTDERPVRRKI